jgi:uncharacterized protein YndB with AHSA1/START domain
MKWLARILLALVLLVLLVVLGLFLAGKREGAGFNQVTVEISRPPEQVWRHLTEPELTRKWMSDIREVTPLTEGGLRVGARSRMVVAVDADETMVLEDEITRVEPPHRLELTIKSGAEADVSFVEHAIYTLEPQDGRTKLTVTARSDFSGVASLFEPIITPTAKAGLEKQILALKAAVEAEPAAEPATARP